MVSASDKSQSVATRFEQGEKNTGKQLATMQESIAESLKRELQPIRKSLQDLHLCQRQKKSLAAERDVLLVELMKMLMSLCESKAQKAESPQAIQIMRESKICQLIFRIVKACYHRRKSKVKMIMRDHINTVPFTHLLLVGRRRS
ncbi:hypothetical protein IQ07DRAFT_311816 [Pyrenochaeta sp. DS3sAY3a]|nr:hypothetical protein IQ07DRAFT_311816 [Pyrenochaeta sp. DS3sAY3a]